MSLQAPSGARWSTSAQGTQTTARVQKAQAQGTGRLARRVRAWYAHFWRHRLHEGDDGPLEVLVPVRACHRHLQWPRGERVSATLLARVGWDRVVGLHTHVVAWVVPHIAEHVVLVRHTLLRGVRHVGTQRGATRVTSAVSHLPLANSTTRSNDVTVGAARANAPPLGYGCLCRSPQARMWHTSGLRRGHPRHPHSSGSGPTRHGRVSLTTEKYAGAHSPSQQPGHAASRRDRTVGARCLARGMHGTCSRGGSSTELSTHGSMRTKYVIVRPRLHGMGDGGHGCRCPAVQAASGEQGEPRLAQRRARWSRRAKHVHRA